MKYISLKHVYPKDKRGVSIFSKSNALKNNTVNIYLFYVFRQASYCLEKTLSYHRFHIADFNILDKYFHCVIQVEIYLHIIPNITEQNIRATNPVK